MTPISVPSVPANPVRVASLALLYQDFLTGVVRIQSGRQPIRNPDAFRGRMRQLLASIQREATRGSYSSEDLADAQFAVVAFLDEAVLASDDPARAQWANRSLQEEIYGQAMGGEVVFERLERLGFRPDSPELADVLEVYLLCLLLGYEGRFALGQKGELYAIMQRLRERLDRIRGRHEALSPLAELPDEVPVAPGGDPWTRRAGRLAAGALALASLAYVAYWVALGGQVRAVRGVSQTAQAYATASGSSC